MILKMKVSFENCKNHCMDLMLRVRSLAKSKRDYARIWAKYYARR